MKKVLTVILSLAFLLVILYSPQKMAKTTKDNLEVHVIDVGQGDSILIKDGNEAMLIDGGRRSSSETVVNYLKEQGVKDLKYVIGTHPHEDHIGGLIAVLDSFKVENILLPNVINNTIAFEDLLDSIERNDLKITKPSISEKLNVGESELITLAPNSEKYSLTNNYSIVLKLNHGENSFLFTGDAEKTSEKEMFESNKRLLKADVLKVGHHGSKTSSSEKFLDQVKPKYAIISVGNKNSYGHPDKETLAKYYERNVGVYRTDLDGTVVVISDGKNLEFLKKKIAFNPKEPFKNIITASVFGEYASENLIEVAK